jgi:hypothetical protein
MGYRIVPTRLTYPATIRAGQPFSIDMDWLNRGVGRAMRDYTLRLTLADAAGSVVATADAGPLPTRRWVAGQPYTASASATFVPTVARAAAAGAHELRLALVDPASGEDVALPLTGRRPGGAYSVGQVTFIPEAGTGARVSE